MGITFTDGTITTTASEQNLFDTTADAVFSALVFAHNLQDGDSVILKVYVKDQNGSAMREWTRQTIINAQTSPTFFVPPIPTKEFKVTIQRTAGTDRAFTWQRCEIT